MPALFVVVKVLVSRCSPVPPRAAHVVFTIFFFFLFLFDSSSRYHQLWRLVATRSSSRSGGWGSGSSGDGGSSSEINAHASAPVKQALTIIAIVFILVALGPSLWTGEWHVGSSVLILEPGAPKQGHYTRDTERPGTFLKKRDTTLTHLSQKVVVESKVLVVGEIIIQCSGLFLPACVSANRAEAASHRRTTTPLNNQQNAQSPGPSPAAGR